MNLRKNTKRLHPLNIELFKSINYSGPYEKINSIKKTNKKITSSKLMAVENERTSTAKNMTELQKHRDITLTHILKYYDIYEMRQLSKAYASTGIDTETNMTVPESYIKSFEDFLESRYCYENVRFIKETDLFLRCPDEEISSNEFLKQELTKLWNNHFYFNYIRENSTYEINISHEQKILFREHYLENTLPSKKIILSTRKEVLKILHDIFRLFVTTSHI